MSNELTFAMIKPGAVDRGHTGAIIERIEKEGFHIVAMQKGQMLPEMADAFYGVHRERPFFKELMEHITSGSVVAMVLEKDNAVQAWRDLMGDTNPETAAENSLRKLYGTHIGDNGTHGSDALETAVDEIGLFFPEFLEEDEDEDEGDE